jgi:predicted RNase H-like HicB family nuclease
MKPLVKFQIHAKWDEDARVWVAFSDDIVGLSTEADTVEELEARLLEVVPELIELNGIKGHKPNNNYSNIPFQLHASKELRLCG